jgi:hypothetical protein
LIRVKVNPEGFERLRRKADAIRLTQADRSGPLLREMDREHIRQVRRAFTSEGGSVPSGPWPKLAPRYAKWKLAQVGRKKILRFKDTLFKKATNAGHPDHLRVFTPPFKYGFGFRDEPGFRHETGDPPLPRRSLVEKSEADYQGFIAVLVGFWRKRILQVARSAGAV